MNHTSDDTPGIDLNECMDVCRRAARAGAEVVQSWIGHFRARRKGAAKDLVTQADLASQEAIRQVVSEAFPDHALLGEEEGLGHQARRAADFRWIADPLDGTTNYVHGVPHYCVSVALERAGRLLVGVVYDPNRDECYTARAGGGAFCNGRRLACRATTRLDEALAAVGFPHNLRPDSPDLRVFLDVAPRCQSVRRMGSAALNLCYVAAGRFDVFWSFSTKTWDVAAGVLIVREAGGTVTAPTGGELKLETGQLLTAATAALHGEMLTCVRRATGGG